MRITSLIAAAVGVLFLAGCGGPKECKTLEGCCKKLKKSDNEAIAAVCEEIDEVVKAKDKDVCGAGVEGIVSVLEATEEEVPKECKMDAGDKKKKKGDDDDDGDKKKKKGDDDEDDDDKKKDDDDDDDDKKKDDDDDAKKDDDDKKKDDDKGGGGGGGACDKYKTCMDDYLKALDGIEGMPAGSMDSTKDAMKAGLKDLDKAGDAVCKSMLDGMAKAADAYKAMKGFKFPDSCKAD